MNLISSSTNTQDINKQKYTCSISNIENVTKLLRKSEKKAVITNTKPWLNSDGSRKSDKEIEELGRCWSTKTWNEYLDDDLGTIKDDLSFFGNMDTSKVYERAEVLSFLQECEYHESLENGLLLGIMELSRLEKEILKLSFWRMLTDIEIAKELESTHGSIRTNKSVAIKKLAKILSSEKFQKKLKLLRKNKNLIRVIKQQKQWLNAK